MTLNRINVRFKKDNLDDMRAWRTICDYAQTHNCSMNKAIINIIKDYSASENEFDVNTVAYKISEVLRTELELKAANVNQESESTIDSEGLDNLFDFIDML